MRTVNLSFLLLSLGLGALTACGSSESDSANKPSPVNIPAEPAPAAVASFVYPTQKSNVAGLSQIPLTVNITTNDAALAVSQLSVGGVEFSQNGNNWSSTSDLVLANTGTNNQRFDVRAEIAQTGEWITLEPLILHSGNGVPAGSQFVASVTSVAIDPRDNRLYFTNPSDASVYTFDATTGTTTTIYTGQPSAFPSFYPQWPIAIDSINNTAYILADQYNTPQAPNAYRVSLLAINNLNTAPQATVFNDEQTQAVNPKGIVLDSNASLAGSVAFNQPTAAVYSLNESNVPFTRWFIENVEGVQGGDDFIGLSSPFNPQQVDGANLFQEFGLAAIAAKPGATNGRLIAAREYSTVEKRGAPALVELTTEDDGFGGKVSTVKHLTDLDGVTLPSALAYNRQGTHVFVADNNRIWQVDMTDYSKTLVTSTVSPTLVGEGVATGIGVTAMAVHPTLDYLYLAADTKGIIMVDLATGNRITLVK